MLQQNDDQQLGATGKEEKQQVDEKVGLDEESPGQSGLNEEAAIMDKGGGPSKPAAGPSPSAFTEDQQSLRPTADLGELEEPKKQQKKSRARKNPTTKTEAFIRQRLSTSLPNCALLADNQEAQEASAKSKDQKNPQQSREKQQKPKTTGKENQPKAKKGGAGPAEGRGAGGDHRAEQRMQAFLGTVKLKETVEFLRGTIGEGMQISPISQTGSLNKDQSTKSKEKTNNNKPEAPFSPINSLVNLFAKFRSRRKGADLGGGGGKDATRPCPVNNAGNGVCPVPETVTASSSNCTASGTKKTGVVSFSQAGSAKSARKAVQSMDSCVADSFDEQMINKICTLPRNMDQNEWLAAHVLALFEHVNGISCTLSEICTPVTCSVMSFPGNQKAPWLDERGKRHNYSAMRYIDSVMSCCEAMRTNQAIFPTKYGVPFSSEFEAHSARIVRLLWHCLGHIYTKHWEHLGALNLRPQFGLVLTHLARLAKIYGLMTEKELISVQNTIQLARPCCQQSSQQQRASLKRGMAALEDGGGSNGEQTTKTGTTTTGVNPNTVQGRIQQANQRKQAQERQNNQQAAAMMAMKSGSWGGQSAVMVATAAQANCPEGGILANCQKCYAQTC